MPKSIKTLLDSLLPKQASWKIQLMGNWDTIMGHLHEHVSLQKIYKDALLLGVKDSSWLQELYLLSPLLLETINQSLDKPRINRLHFKNVGDVDRTQPLAAPLPIPRKNERAKRKQPVKQHLTKKQQETLDTVPDPEMREALKQLLFTCYEEEDE